MPFVATAPVGPSDWEPSIMGSTPYEELTRYICDMIFNTIGNADPPTGGAVFEIEAKLGEIHNIEEGRRLKLPVMTETVFDKNSFGPPTRFESSMNIVSPVGPFPQVLVHNHSAVIMPYYRLAY
jgi:mRNA capping enzyme, beta chain